MRAVVNRGCKVIPILARELKQDYRAIAGSKQKWRRIMSNTIQLPHRKVIKNDGQYVVIEFEKKKPNEWAAVSKRYGHSISAFAALGRLTQKDTRLQ
jgi:hypothetical protein